MAVLEPSDFFSAPGLEMNPARIAVENAIVRGQRALAVSLDSISLLVRFGVFQAKRPFCAAWADFRTTDGRARITLDSVAFLPTVRAMLLDAPLPDSLPPDLAGAIAELVVDTLPDSAGVSLEGAGLGMPPAAFGSGGNAPWQLGMRVETSDGQLLANGVLYCEESVATALPRALDTASAEAAAPMIEPDAVGRAQLASIQIPLEEFENLHPLDVLVLGAYGLGGKVPIRLFFASGLIFFGSLDGEIITMNTEEKTDGNNQDSAPAQPVPADLEKLPVRIGFELGSVTVTLAELRSLAAGSVVEIPVPLDAPVTLRANGKEIGHGALLRVGDHVAVRILDLGAQKA